MSRWRALLVGVGVSSLGCVATPEETTSDEEASQAESGLTVAQAANSSCSTSVVEGLSFQIIDEANCIEPGAFSEVPARPNLSPGGAAYLFLEAPARDALLAALAQKPGTTLTVNSMLRTPAQQYLLRRWDLNGQCGIAVAANPGSSKHESGLALDVEQYGTWRSTLKAKGFTWAGSGDPVHFTFAGAGAVDHRDLGVLAFQRLWNRNHPNDKIYEDGDWGPATSARMKAAPADGFAQGAICADDCDAQFKDLCGTPYRPHVEWLADEGAAKGCSATLFCVNDGASRGQLAWFLTALLGLPAGPERFSDDDGSPWESAANAAAAAGLTVGCNAAGTAFCPDAVVTRAEVATWLVRAYDLPAGPDAFDDDDGSPHEDDINALAAAGVTSGCSTTQKLYCPDLEVSRGELATLLHLAATH